MHNNTDCTLFMSILYSQVGRLEKRVSPCYPPSPALTTIHSHTPSQAAVSIATTHCAPVAGHKQHMACGEGVYLTNTVLFLH